MDESRSKRGSPRGRTVRMAAAFASFAAVAVVVAACGGSDDDDGGGGGSDVESAVFALPGPIVNADPANNYDYNTASIGQQWCEPLLRMDATGQLEPSLATEWTQPDATTYVYTLREDVQFHDGTTMTAEDVKFSLDRHRDADLGSYLGGFHERVESVDVTGDNEVTVTLSEPDATFQYAVATQAGHIVKQEFVESNGDETGLVSDPNAGIVCTGAYQFVDWIPGEVIRMSAFPEYWDGEPAIKQVEFRVIEDEQTLVAGLNSGEIDGAINAPGGQAALGLDSDEVNLLSGESTNAASVAVNTQKAPFDDPRVAQGLSLALDKEGIGESAFGGFTKQSKAPAMPSLWTYSQEIFEPAYDALPGFEQDVDAAKALIAEAGAEGAKADLLVSTPIDEEVGLAVQDAAAEIGLEITPNKVPFNDKTAEEYSGEPRTFGATLLTWGSDFPDPIGNMYFPFNSALPVTNVVQYDNPEVDAALDAARGAVDNDERANLLVEAQAQIVEDQPWIVYAWPDVLMPLNNRLTTDYEPNGFWYFQDWLSQISGA